MDIIAPHMQNQHQIDVVMRIRELREQRQILTRPVVDLLAPLQGFKDCDDYVSKSSAHLTFPSMTVPTLFLTSDDDPMMMNDFDKAPFAQNPNIALATLKSGGHVGTHESVFGYDIWMFKPTIAFL